MVIFIKPNEKSFFLSQPRIIVGWSIQKSYYEIYTQRHLPKWVYRNNDYTMVCVDTHTDGNKFLQIFDNKKEIK